MVLGVVVGAEAVSVGIRVHFIGLWVKSVTAVHFLHRSYFNFSQWLSLFSGMTIKL